VKRLLETIRSEGQGHILTTFRVRHGYGWTRGFCRAGPMGMGTVSVSQTRGHTATRDGCYSVPRVCDLPSPTLTLAYPNPHL
jgi:hypothetical protein